MNAESNIKELGFWESFSIYISAGLLLYLMTHYLIPYLSKLTGQETILFWFIVAGLGVFTPLIIASIFILRTEGYRFSKSTWIDRLRFRKITKFDLIWSIGGLIAVGIMSGVIMKGLEFFIGDFHHSPSFLSFEPLNEGRYWLLFAWFPYWILNIMGEELLWRGVMMPRQEVAFGKHTWIVHGVGWAIFHIAFGWQLLLTMIPVIFILSYAVQRTKNSWVGTIIHGGLNGPSFLAISFGLI